uniref:DNA repair protein complementing XP-A cells homolog n=1 Tax=Phallusia mammillata TaxID=59560 RepID=A0A6F9DXQ3_9ASCI|nr:DNA repair protein complementing XP-A cells homolog [Phallusia mammillata]
MTEKCDKSAETEQNNKLEAEIGTKVTNDETVTKPKKELTATQKARIERNRQKALLLRQSRLSQQQLLGTKTTTGCSRVIDTGGGFLLEENPDVKPRKLNRVEEPAPVIAGDDSICLECDKPFQDSYLLTTYDHQVCDKCRDPEEKHSVITKTEARETYLLSEVDITKREPILKYVVRKNPHNRRWGDMKLYLRLQIEERALEVWKTPEALEEERDSREQKREIAKKKKFNKNMKKLRQEVRSSLFEVKSNVHTHVFGPEIQSETDEDIYTKTCIECDHQITFEKM